MVMTTEQNTQVCKQHHWDWQHRRLGSVHVALQSLAAIIKFALVCET